MISNPSPTLSKYFEEQYLLLHNLKAPTAVNMRRSIKLLTAWLGHEPTIAELTSEIVSRWVMEMEKSCAPKTAKNRRADIMAIWKDAYCCDESDTVKQPRRVRAIKVPDPEPDSWSADDVAKLVAAARAIPGYFRPEYRSWEVLPRALYLEAVIRTAWETGLRRSDLITLRMEQIGPDGIVAKAQGKTGGLHCGRLEPETVALLHKLNRNPPLEWNPDGVWGLYYWISKVRDLAGLGTSGGLQRIRASSATNVAIFQPGAETKFLGHTSAKADKWYIDKRRLPSSAVSPQRLPLASEAEGGDA